jgi:endoglucanase
LSKFRNFSGLSFAAQALLLSLLVCVFLFIREARATDVLPTENNQTFTQAKTLGRGINLGNFFDAPVEGYWSMKYDESLLDRVKEAGFDTLRLPVRWSNHAAASAPYAIDPVFTKRIQGVVDAALARGLHVVMDMHHYRQLNGENIDEAEKKVSQQIVEERYLALWGQIAKQFASYPQQLLFEPFNEPNKRLDGPRWSTLFEAVRQVIRKSNPNRYLVVGPAQWNNAEALSSLSLNKKDRRLIVTIHHYEPFEFTHQGAEWTTIDMQKARGTTCCNTEQLARIDKPLATAIAWSKKEQRPIWVGEWGSFDKAPIESRLAYTKAMVSALKRYELTWAYWELASSFGIWNPKENRWRDDLKAALLHNK